MNKEGREKISNILSKLDEIVDEIDTLKDEEQEKFDNIPEQLQEGDPAQAILNIVEDLEAASSSLEDVKGYLDNI